MRSSIGSALCLDLSRWNRTRSRGKKLGRARFSHTVNDVMNLTHKSGQFGQLMVSLRALAEAVLIKCLFVFCEGLRCLSAGANSLGVDIGSRPGSIAMDISMQLRGPKDDGSRCAELDTPQGVRALALPVLVSKDCPSRSLNGRYVFLTLAVLDLIS